MKAILCLTDLARTGAAVLGLSFAVASAAPALAAGDDGGGGGTPVNCEKGETFNDESGKCEKTSLLDDDTLTSQGRVLALNGYYEGALEALMAVRDKNDATVLTYIGYATRKLGQVEEGIAWYHKALAIEPDNLYTREYLGEGYVAAGRLDLANRQLDRLERLCGKDCKQYEALAASIAGEPESWGGSI